MQADRASHGSHGVSDTGHIATQIGIIKQAHWHGEIKRHGQEQRTGGLAHMSANSGQLTGMQVQFSEAGPDQCDDLTGTGRRGKANASDKSVCRGGDRPESSCHNRLSKQEAGSLKTVAAPGLVPDLGRPHRILFQFLRGNSAHVLVLGGQNHLVNQWLGLLHGQIRMLLKMICKFNDLPRRFWAVMASP
ncbi:MAG: hypothetical protein ACI9GK_001816 [Devosia sp.]|jgi:hypothetical protein|tara:strand:- start:5811 stop:6380 length:570 start_codon:yes stop_codon:yes gene_type:complete